MARGYPDFFGFSVFPWYGALSSVLDNTTVIAPGNSATVVDLALKGRSQGGILWLWSTASIDTDRVSIIIDGTEFAVWGFSVWESYHHNANYLPILMRYYNLDIFFVSFEFGPDWVFGTQYKVVITNNGTGNLGVDMRFYYNVIV